MNARFTRANLLMSAVTVNAGPTDRSFVTLRRPITGCPFDQFILLAS